MEIHLLIALKDLCAYNLDGDFNELLKDVHVEIENSSDAAICAVEAPITQEVVLDAEALEGSEGEAPGEVSATSQASSFTKVYAYAVTLATACPPRWPTPVYHDVIAMGLLVEPGVQDCGNPCHSLTLVAVPINQMHHMHTNTSHIQIFFSKG